MTSRRQCGLCASTRAVLTPKSVSHDRSLCRSDGQFSVGLRCHRGERRRFENTRDFAVIVKERCDIFAIKTDLLQTRSLHYATASNKGCGLLSLIQQKFNHLFHPTSMRLNYFLLNLVFISWQRHWHMSPCVWLSYARTYVNDIQTWFVVQSCLLLTLIDTSVHARQP